MSIATITLSSKGQLVIPREIRDELSWNAGTKLTLVSSLNGVTLQGVPKKTGRKLVDLAGMLKQADVKVSTEQLCAPVDYTNPGAQTQQARKRISTGR